MMHLAKLGVARGFSSMPHNEPTAVLKLGTRTVPRPDLNIHKAEDTPGGEKGLMEFVALSVVASRIENPNDDI